MKLMSSREGIESSGFGEGSGPPQKAWRVSSVVRAFRNLYSKGITSIRLRKSSCSGVIVRRAWATKKQYQVNLAMI